MVMTDSDWYINLIYTHMHQSNIYTHTSDFYYPSIYILKTKEQYQ